MTTPQQSGVDVDSDKPFKPMSFSEYIWARCKSQPLIPIGCVATVGALVGATVALRTGNRRTFNQWLRFRVLAQGATVMAMVVYGSVALTREQQNAHYIKSQVLLGDLPPDTPWPGRKPGEGPTTPTPAQLEAQAAAEAAAKATAAEAASAAAGRDAAAYPLPKKERMRASDFARRLKEAEKLQKEEEEAKRAK
ncbi:hypothetical protein JCM24511_04446 [Saitozyma sp. JCM 24511]|nr:hypothetical protein JCM24511_04446 [Saitozyma sp. JCM 24511]